MKNRLVFGSMFMICGAASIVLPLYVFTPCGDDMRYAMPCLYGTRAVAGLGGLVAAGGLVTLLSADRGARRGVAWMVAGAAALMPLTLCWLVGICAMETMFCQLATKPAVSVLATLTALAGIAGALSPGRKRVACGEEADDAA